jgi:hypothetical protein
MNHGDAVHNSETLYNFIDSNIQDYMNLLWAGDVANILLYILSIGFASNIDFSCNAE